MLLFGKLIKLSLKTPIVFNRTGFHANQITNLLFNKPFTRSMFFDEIFYEFIQRYFFRLLYSLYFLPELFI